MTGLNDIQERIVAVETCVNKSKKASDASTENEMKQCRERLEMSESSLAKLSNSFEKN